MPIAKAHLETYRAAARAYRAVRRKNARQHEWHRAALREVIKRHPEMGHREADSFAQHIIRYVSPIMGSGFGIEPLLEGIPSELGCDFLHLLAEGFPLFEGQCVTGRTTPLRFRLEGMASILFCLGLFVFV